MNGGWVYIMTNRRNGTLYVGTTVDLARRAWEHREGVADGFTKRRGLKAHGTRPATGKTSALNTFEISPPSSRRENTLLNSDAPDDQHQVDGGK
jgi:hypothetical protein